MDTDVVFDLRWSWLHWWEANRDRYLRSQSQITNRQKPDPARLDALREKATAALIEALNHDYPDLRAAAALALGRLDAQSAVEPLIKIADGDASPDARRAAIVALGLIDMPESRAFLFEEEYPTPEMREAGLVAISLLSEIDAKTRRRLQQLFTEPANIATAAAFALTQHTDETSREWFELKLQATDSPWLASELILAFGHYRDPKGLRLLQALLTTPFDQIQRSDVKQLFVCDDLFDRDQDLHSRVRAAQEVRRQAQKRSRTYDQDYENFQRSWDDYWAKRDPNRVGQAPGKLPTLIQSANFVFGKEQIYYERLRAAAAVATDLLDVKQAERPLLTLLNERADKYNHTPQGFAAIALGELATRDAAQALANTLSNQSDRGHLKTQEQIEHPVRGYAALALGIYCRPEETPQGPYDRPGTEKILELLGERLLDQREELEVRAACALALGLTGRSSALPVLRRLDNELNDADEPLVGYVFLARGLLADRNILQPAQRFLKRGNPRDAASIVGSRAAVLGVGVLGSDESIPVLTEAWHQNLYISREVIVALRLAEVYSVADTLLDELQSSNDPQVRQFMAEALGELLQRPEPTSLQVFLANTNYTMKNQVLMPFQRMTNVFLIDYLIPQTGEWR